MIECVGCTEPIPQARLGTPLVCACGLRYTVSVDPEALYRRQQENEREIHRLKRTRRGRAARKAR